MDELVEHHSCAGSGHGEADDAEVIFMECKHQKLRIKMTNEKAKILIVALYFCTLHFYFFFSLMCATVLSPNHHRITGMARVMNQSGG